MAATTASSSGNGVVFLICQRISSSRSAPRAGTVSKRTRLTRRNRIRHDQGHPPGADAGVGQRPRHRRPDPGTSGMFGAASAPLTAPSGSASTA